MTMTTTTLPSLLSPCCQRPLEGGPVVFWCTGCRKDVHGSTIDREFKVVDCTHLHNAFGAGCPWCAPVRRKS